MPSNTTEHVQAMYRCKKCGDLFPGNDLHRHAVCCYDDSQIDITLDYYDFSHFRKVKRNERDKDIVPRH